MLLGQLPLAIHRVSSPSSHADIHARLAQRAGDKYLLFGSDQAAMKHQFLKFFSQEDWEATQRLQVRHSPPWLTARPWQSLQTLPL